VPVDAMPKPKAPSEAELLEACRAAKAAHPDFGVKRVYNHVAASKPEWRLTERRVQKVMRANKLTEKNSAGDGRRAGAGAAPGSPGPPAEIAPSLFPEDCVALARKPSQLGWVLKASGVLGGDDDDYYEDDADDERRREVPEGMAPGQEKSDSSSLRHECSARARCGKSIHPSRALREMIARPKISRNEWKTTEI